MKVCIGSAERFHAFDLARQGVNLTLFRQAPKEDKVFRVIYVGTLSFWKLW